MELFKLVHALGEEHGYLYCPCGTKILKSKKLDIKHLPSSSPQNKQRPKCIINFEKEKGLLIFHLLSRRLDEYNHTGEGRGNQANALATLLRNESMNQANYGCRSVVKLSRT